MTSMASEHVFFLPDMKYPEYEPPSVTRPDGQYVYVNAYRHPVPQGARPDFMRHGQMYADVVTMLANAGAKRGLTEICRECNRPFRFGEVIAARSRDRGGKGKALRFWHLDCSRPFGSIATFSHMHGVPERYVGTVHDPFYHLRGREQNTSAATDKSERERSRSENTSADTSEQTSADENLSERADTSATDQQTLDTLTDLLAGLTNNLRAEFTAQTATLRSEIESLRSQLADAQSKRQTEMHIVVTEAEREARQNLGLVHKQFGLLLNTLLGEDDPVYRNAYLCGPAGTGKTTAARQVFEALAAVHGKTPGEDFFLAIIGPVGSQYDMRGFIDANGKIHHPELEKVWRIGGVVIWDELRAHAWDAILWTNGGLSADGYLPFAGGAVKRSEYTYALCGDNTWGYGGNAKYTGNAIDQSSLNRWYTIPWGPDERLEHLVTGTDPVVTAWTDAVQATRDLIEQKNAQVTISTRQMHMGRSQIRAARLTAAQIVEATVSNLRSTSKWAEFGGPIMQWQTQYAAEVDRRISERRSREAALVAERTAASEVTAISESSGE